MNSMPTIPSRVFTGLTEAQADGRACVRCGVDYLTVRVPSRPVGRSETESQVFACTDQCADAVAAAAEQRKQEASVIVAVVSWFAQRDKDRERDARQAHRDAANRAAAALSTPACPDWCTEGAGHTYMADWGDEGRIRRTHEASVFKTGADGHGVSISQDEFYCDGTVTLDIPELYIEWESIDPAAVRACGRALANAAVMVEKIAAATTIDPDDVGFEEDDEDDQAAYSVDPVECIYS